MKKFEVTMEAELSVSFSNPEKAKSFFIDGDFRKYFYEISDMEELVKYIAVAFHHSHEYFDKAKNAFARSPEGFGFYVKKENNYYEADWVEFGKISIRYEQELEATSAYEA